VFPYTHLVWAHRLQDKLGVQNLAEFNLGAILPDVRYVDDLPWKQTHPPLDEFWERALAADKADRDFALGYLLHLAMDQWELDIMRRARQRYPLGRLIPRRLFKLIMEAASLEQYPLPQIPLSDRVPELALSLGIPEETIHLLRSMADGVLAEPGLEQAVVFVQGTQLAKNPTIRWLMWAAIAILKTPLRHLLLRPATRVLKRMEAEVEQNFLDEVYAFVKGQGEEHQEDTGHVS
jgi:hypothetical protein